ncbi:hypothetical protein RFI_21248 [Reticulomyxa filosa]|uniref:Uncharacterized protein n=1 Tax=Reticulomyxa filosa TaxID=46433 RepID=X6MSM5_RETFI|nr:hypothetical protein RFI_21248 [Reticulomyxa filosa]|eukprot:ETO16110.1 hypothetical protein RFI_21248 [Reticulomyxa filosa]
MKKEVVRRYETAAPQVIAVSTPKPGACSMEWNECVEVYCAERGQWVHVNVLNGNIHLDNTSVSSLKCNCVMNTRCHYLVSVDEFMHVCDVTPRYANVNANANGAQIDQRKMQWTDVVRKRGVRFHTYWNGQILQQTTIAHNQLLARFPLLQKRYNCAKRNAINKTYQQQLSLCKQAESIPKKFSQFKNHPLYCIQKYLKKFEYIYPQTPKDAIGEVEGQAVYPRSHVHKLHAKRRWFREGWVVLDNESPVKIVNSRSSTNVQPTELFGKWQCVPYIPPCASDGIVPKNDFGSVELWSPQHLPSGCVHLSDPFAVQACKTLHLDYAKAVVGFLKDKGLFTRRKPVFDGVVVCKEHYDQVKRLCDELLVEQQVAIQEQEESQIDSLWTLLVSGLMVKREMEAKIKHPCQINYDDLCGQAL